MLYLIFFVFNLFFPNALKIFYSLSQLRKRDWLSYYHTILFLILKKKKLVNRCFVSIWAAQNPFPKEFFVSLLLIKWLFFSLIVSILSEKRSNLVSRRCLWFFWMIDFHNFLSEALSDSKLQVKHNKNEKKSSSEWLLADIEYVKTSET